LDTGPGNGADAQATDASFSEDVVTFTMEHDSAPSGVLSVDPATTTLTITNLASPPAQAFTATLTSGTSSTKVVPNWTLADYTVGLVDSSGTFTPKGTISGDVTVIATYQGETAQATIHVVVNAQSTLASTTLPDGTSIPQDGTQVTPPDQTALNGTPMTEPGMASTLIYPYDKTVVPRGLLAPVLEYTAGAVAPVDFKISLDTTAFHWDGFGHVGNPSALQSAIPQNVWDGALLSAQSDPTTHEAVVTLSLVKAAAGVAYGPYQAHLIVAPGQLTGIIYYESYGSDVVENDAGGGNGGTDFGLWSVKPGTSELPKNLESGCVICHGVSAAGNTLTAGTDDPTVGSNTGVFRLEADGGMTQLAVAPTILPYAIGGAIDSRGLGWATVSPDGLVALRGVNQFWGGQSLLAWAVPSSPLLGEDGGIAPLSTSMTVSGDFNMFVPSYSVDGKHLVYINAANPDDAGSGGAPSQSVGIVDITESVLDGGTGGTVTLSNPHTVYDTTASGATPAGTFTKVPTFLPDSQTIVLEETVANYTGYDHMLPDYGGVDGTLSALQPNSASPQGYTHVALANANAGYDPASPTSNYEPKALPVQVGGYYWVVFASLRKDAYPNATPKKLWVTAITPGAAPGTDPSHPPFTLINQSIVPAQPSQRGYWALSPCQQNGTSCVTSSDCCNGSCLPEDPTNPTSPLVCGAAPPAACVPLGGRCTAGQNGDCCNSTAGVECIGTLNGYGTCAAPAPR
jgi:hypothetical protein